MRWAQNTLELKAAGLMEALDPGPYHVWDQQSVGEAVISTLVGRPFVMATFAKRLRWPPGWDAPKFQSTMRRALARVGQLGPLGGGPFYHVQHVVPLNFARQHPMLDPSVGGDMIIMGDMRMPHARGQWPAEWGGLPYERELPPYAAHLRQLFADLTSHHPPHGELRRPGGAANGAGACWV